MSDVYTPPEVWDYDPANGGQFAGINRPTAGAREEHELPVGEHPFQLYSLGTPNGVKATIMFEELLEAGFSGAEYDAWIIKIFEGAQFWSGFVDINPNSKIPALVDRSGPEPFRVFESGAILVHLAEKFDYLLPKTNPARAETFSWLMWQMGSAPFIGGGLGHFNVYHGAYNGSDKFLSLHEYENVGRWAKTIDARPGAIRGRLVNTQAMAERHSAADFDAVEDRSLFEPVRKRADV